MGYVPESEDGSNLRGESDNPSSWSDNPSSWSSKAESAAMDDGVRGKGLDLEALLWALVEERNSLLRLLALEARI